MKETMFLGTYTKRESEGVYSITLDTEKQQLEELTLIAKADGPTYVGLSENQDILYAIDKVNGDGALSSFKKDDSGNYQLVASVSAPGAPPCYVGVDDQRGFLYTANYHKGEIAVIKTDKDGNLTLLDTVTHTGSSIHENQAGPHAHYSDLTPDHKYIVACDLGTDAVYTYSVSTDGKLTEVSRYDAKPGTGPRHIVFNPNGKVAYLFGELASVIVVLAYDATTGTFSELQTISTIPEEFTDFNGGAAIRVSKDGKFLYASNRGHDSIVVYKISPDGTTLEQIQLIASEGKIPRDFNLDPTEGFIIAAHQDSDNLTLFARNNETGLLSLIQKDVYAPECVCVYF
ncbi:lactonase family protein [Carnobacterium gallinarum]|uniref:lactonase family protein n=1 Tax=Carnobacterium gallinarum TaxID=2749 RepID=UPI00054F6D33|nr:lactonase family protein [Carnobacterium gallinarum]